LARRYAARGRAILIGSALGLALQMSDAALADTGDCAAAAALAEQEYGLPSGLLSAIGRVESGRADPDTGRMTIWPWTTNAAGKGGYWPTREAAIAAVRQAQEGGTQSVDVGCFQVNLLHHPNAFQSLEQAFDPTANARYAARFLSALRQRTGDWSMAVMHYHSADPEIGPPYRDRVLAAWTQTGDGSCLGRWGAEGHPTLRDSNNSGCGIIQPVIYKELFGIHIWTPHNIDNRGAMSAVNTPSLPRIIYPNRT
jgi:hypothetical protein